MQLVFEYKGTHESHCAPIGPSPYREQKALSASFPGVVYAVLAGDAFSQNLRMLCTLSR